MYTDPPCSKTDEWGKSMLLSFGQLLNIMQPKIQEFVMEMWNHVEKLYSVKNNLNRVFVVIQKRVRRATKFSLNTMQTSIGFMRS